MRWYPPSFVKVSHGWTLVLGDRDNAAADANAAIAWQHAYVDPSGVVVGADPQYRLRAALAGEPAALPLMVIVDTHTMEMVDWLANPHPIDLRRRLRDLSGSPISEPSPTLVDDLFLAHEWALLQQTTLPTSPPASASNEAADSPLAAALGHRLFFDAGLSPSGAVSCASCHQPEHGLSDASPQAVGVAAGARRTPRIALASHGRWQFWDGRADSLWSQALAPFENPLEFDSSRTLVARRVLSKHLAAFTSAFPNTPLPDHQRLARAGQTGRRGVRRTSTATAGQHHGCFRSCGKGHRRMGTRLTGQKYPIGRLFKWRLRSVGFYGEVRASAVCAQWLHAVSLGTIAVRRGIPQCRFPSRAPRRTTGRRTS